MGRPHGKSFIPTHPESFWSMAVGSQFFATDLAGLTTSLKSPGIRVTRTGSETWNFDTFRVHSQGSADRLVRVERWPITATGSYFLRPAYRRFPPDPAGGPSGSGHYPGALPAELVSLGTDVSSKQP